MKVCYYYYHTDTPYTLFMSGFGFLPNAFKPKSPTIMVYDYSDMSNHAQICQLAQQARNLIAWSMGVSIASRLIDASLVQDKQNIAINGTPWGIDSEFGIHPRLFTRTHQKFERKAFLRGCFGTDCHIDSQQDFLPNDTTLIHELQAIESFCASHTLKDSMLVWHKALISKQDSIFNPIAQKKAWETYTQTNKNCIISMLDAPHFIFDTMDIL